MSTDELQVEDRDAVRIITLNRPARRNALTVQSVATLARVVEAAPDEGIRALVLTGAGDHFCAGADAETALHVTQQAERPEVAHRLLTQFHAPVLAIWNSELPVIAAVAGVAYGGGCNLALLCDLVYATPDARFCEVFLRRGLVPDLGGTWLLPRIVGMQRAKQLAFLTEEISGTRACELGLVNAVLPDANAALAQAVETATRLAQAPATAVALTKRLFNAGGGLSFEAALKLEAVIQADLLRTPGAQQGFGGFLKKD
ncbi:MAG TPA: enoyl-CoA hydratase-related protein [Nevskiaceae bacterium]|nr:enoyl-CoA hydratase-related protein [Nevskiaceae bacterium]